MSDFNVKIVKKRKKKRNLVIFSQADICFEKTGLEEQTMVYVRKSCLSPGDKARENPFVPAIPLCLKNSADFAPRPGVKGNG
jgi:hypothetical protein